jgi:hypothetical protein
MMNYCMEFTPEYLWLFKPKEAETEEESGEETPNTEAPEIPARLAKKPPHL